MNSGKYSTTVNAADIALTFPREEEGEVEEKEEKEEEDQTAVASSEQQAGLLLLHVGQSSAEQQKHCWRHYVNRGGPSKMKGSCAVVSGGSETSPPLLRHREVDQGQRSRASKAGWPQPS